MIIIRKNPYLIENNSWETDVNLYRRYSWKPNPQSQKPYLKIVNE